MTATRTKPGAATKARAIGVRFHQIQGDTMSPTIRHRDFVLVAPIEQYVGDGYYMLSGPFGEPEVHSCDGFGGTRERPEIRLAPHNKAYPSSSMPKVKFDELVLGKVTMICSVVDHGLLREVVQ